MFGCIDYHIIYIMVQIPGLLVDDEDDGLTC